MEATRRLLQFWKDQPVRANAAAVVDGFTGERDVDRAAPYAADMLIPRRLRFPPASRAKAPGESWPAVSRGSAASPG
jgi:hypothetical protein